MADVFVSYSRGDRKLAEQIVAALNEKGLSVWWDQRLTPVESWDKIIEAEINAAGAVLVLWTKTSVNSDWVRAEANFAKEKNRLVQATFGACEIPLAFRMRQFANLTAWPREGADEWRKCLDWIAVMVGRSFKPDLAPEPPPPPTPALPDPGPRVIRRIEAGSSAAATPAAPSKLRHVLTLEHETHDTISALHFSKDRRVLAAATKYGGLCAWDIRVEKLIFSARTGLAENGRHHVYTDGSIISLLNTGTGEGNVRQYDLRSAGDARAMAFASVLWSQPSPDGRLILIKNKIAYDKVFGGFEVLDLKSLRRKAYISTRRYSSNLGAVANEIRAVVLEAEPASKGLDWMRRGAFGIIFHDAFLQIPIDHQIALSPSGRFLASTSIGRCNIYSKSGLIYSNNSTWRVSFISDKVVVMSAAGYVHIHNIDRGICIAKVMDEEDLNQACAVSSDGSVVAVGSGSGEVRLYAWPADEDARV